MIHDSSHDSLLLLLQKVGRVLLYQIAHLCQAWDYPLGSVVVLRLHQNSLSPQGCCKLWDISTKTILESRNKKDVNRWKRTWQAQQAVSMLRLIFQRFSSRCWCEYTSYFTWFFPLILWTSRRRPLPRGFGTRGDAELLSGTLLTELGLEIKFDAIMLLSKSFAG